MCKFGSCGSGASSGLVWFALPATVVLKVIEQLGRVASCGTGAPLGRSCMHHAIHTGQHDMVSTGRQQLQFQWLGLWEPFSAISACAAFACRKAPSLLQGCPQSRDSSFSGAHTCQSSGVLSPAINAGKCGHSPGLWVHACLASRRLRSSAWSHAPSCQERL